MPPDRKACRGWRVRRAQPVLRERRACRVRKELLVSRVCQVRQVRRVYRDRPAHLDLQVLRVLKA